MPCVPAPRLVVLQVAVFAFAAPPVNATALQPPIEMPSAMKLTLPVGALPLTVAVNVTLAPSVDGLPELVTVVVVAVLAGAETERVSVPAGPGVTPVTVTLMPYVASV